MEPKVIYKYVKIGEDKRLLEAAIAIDKAMIVLEMISKAHRRILLEEEWKIIWGWLGNDVIKKSDAKIICHEKAIARLKNYFNNLIMEIQL